MSQTVIGIFDNESEAQQAVQNLVNQGFDRNNVDMAGRTAGYNASDNDEDEGFGSSISNFFSNLFGSDDDRTNKYSEVAKRGITVTVHAQSEAEAERAADILDDFGAVDIDEKASQYNSNWNQSSNISGTENRDPNFDYNRDSDINSRSLPVIEENLEVGKREEESGRARLRSRIVEKPVEENVRLRSEHINVERNPVNRQATDAELENFKEGSIEMTEHREVPVVEKQAWVKEEVSLNKDVEEHDETIHDTLRRTEVDVDRDTDRNRISNEFDDDDDNLDNNLNYRDRDRNV